MTLRKIILRLIVPAIALGVLCACAETKEPPPEESSTRPTITVGCDIYPPYSYTGADGHATGIDIDIAREAFHRIGYEPEFAYIDWEIKQQLLADGEIDCVWSSFSINGRENDYRWAGPYMISRQVVAVMPNSDIYELSDLEGKNIAVQATTKPEELFLSGENSGMPHFANVFSVQDRSLIYPALSKGYVQAVAAHETSIAQYMSDYDVEYRILEEPLLSVGLGVAFYIDDTRGIDESLDAELKDMLADGSMEEIIGRYLPDAASYLEVDEYEG